MFWYQTERISQHSHNNTVCYFGSCQSDNDNTKYDSEETHICFVWFGVLPTCHEQDFIFFVCVTVFSSDQLKSRQGGFVLKKQHYQEDFSPIEKQTFFCCWGSLLHNSFCSFQTWLGCSFSVFASESTNLKTMQLSIHDFYSEGKQAPTYSFSLSQEKRAAARARIPVHHRHHHHRVGGFPFS